MKRPPYSLDEARKFSNRHQYLKGQKFSKESNAVIECVTVVPFDKINKERFLICYFLFNNEEHALATEYQGLLFDVLVIARSATDAHDLQQEDLVVWLKDNPQAAEMSIVAETV